MDLALRRETRTVRQAVNILKEELGLPEDIESAATIPDTAAKVPPLFHQSAVDGLQGLVEPETVDAIVTFPPANAWSGSLLTDLAGFAAHSLKRTGGMFVLAGTERLPEFIERLRHQDLSWVCALHYAHHDPATGSRRNPRGGAPGQKPVLVYGKPGFRLPGGDGVISALPHDEGTQGNRRSHLYVVPVISPSEELVGEFTKLMLPLEQRFSINESDSRTLAAQRDALLQRLVSGDVRGKAN